MNPEWNIRSLGDQCLACEKKFSDKETLTSRLCFSEGGYQREDYCAACWSGRGTGGGGDISAWTTVWRAPAPKTPEALKKETAESMLRQLMETEEAAHRNVIFILAVMLERRRILVEKEVQVEAGGMKIRVYEHKQTGESFVVPDPQLRLQEVESVQREVMELLGVLSPDKRRPEADQASGEVAGE